MAKKSFKTVQYRRKRDSKTNYYKRLNLLKGSKPRLVIRISTSNVLLQIIKFNTKGDEVLVSSRSKDLLDLGWKHNQKNLPSCYLTGLILGKKAKENNVKDAVVDFGFHTSKVKGTRIYAALKGVLDSGLDVLVGEGVFPNEDRLSGSHIATYVKKSENIQKDFEDFKNKIIG